MTMGCGQASLIERLRGDLNTGLVFYQVFPVLTFHPANEPVTWLEVALHAEFAGSREPVGPADLKALAAVEELAGCVASNDLVSRGTDVEISQWYKTLAPPTARGGPVRQFRSLSVRFVNMRPYRKGEQHGLLAEFKAQLKSLGIEPIEGEGQGNAARSQPVGPHG